MDGNVERLMKGCCFLCTKGVNGTSQTQSRSCDHSGNSAARLGRAFQQVLGFRESVGHLSVLWVHPCSVLGCISCAQCIYTLWEESRTPMGCDRKCCLLWCLLHELGWELGGFRVHFGGGGMSEMFVVVQTGNGCFSTLRMCSITSPSPIHPRRCLWGRDNPVGYSSPVVGTLKQRLGPLQDRKRHTGPFTEVTITQPKVSSCFRVQCPAGLRGKGLWHWFSKAGRKWEVSGTELWQKKFPAEICFSDCCMVKIRKARGKKSN